MMQFFFSFFFLFFFSYNLYAENLSDALSELNDITSEWKSVLNQAHTQSFNKSKYAPECAFPDSPEYDAPNWVCGDPVEGVTYSGIGSGARVVSFTNLDEVADERGHYINRIDAPIKAYMNALIDAKSQLDAKLNIMTKKNEATQQPINELSKQIVNINSLSDKVKLTQMVKQYVEFDKNGHETDRVSTIVTRLIYKSENCKLLIKQYDEFAANDESDHAEQTVSSGKCGFYQVVDEMSTSGWGLLAMTRSPANTYFALVGYEEPINDQSNEKNDRTLWEQFKKEEQMKALQKEIGY